MLRCIYTVFDRVAYECHGPLIVENGDGPAIRMFHAVLADSRTLLGQHPKDFELWYLGGVGPQGELVPSSDGPRVVTTGLGWFEAQSREAQPPANLSVER